MKMMNCENCTKCQNMTLDGEIYTIDCKIHGQIKWHISRAELLQCEFHRKRPERRKNENQVG